MDFRAFHRLSHFGYPAQVRVQGNSDVFAEISPGPLYRVIMLWVQGNQNVITSWYGLVVLLAPHYYNSHPLLTTYRIRYKVNISLNNEVNTLEYFNLVIIVR